LASLALALLSTAAPAREDVAAGWYRELYAIQQVSDQLSDGRIRAEGIVQAALNATTAGLEHSEGPVETPPAGANLDAATAQAAHSIMKALYPLQLEMIDARLAKSLAKVDDTPAAIAAGRAWGARVAEAILAKEADSVAANADTFARTAQAQTVQAPGPGAKEAASVQTSPGRYVFTTLAGKVGTKEYRDGTGTDARFDRPGDMAVDAAGNVYVSESDACTVRKITPEGVVSTLAGSPGQRGSVDGVGPAARFAAPIGLAVDDVGNVYVADSGNHTVRKIDPAGVVSTLAGGAGVSGPADGPREVAQFTVPSYVAVDRAGNVFVTEPANPRRRIRKIAPDGTVSTLVVEFLNVSPAWFSDYATEGAPRQIRCDQAGNLYVIYTDMAFFCDVLRLSPKGGSAYAGRTVEQPEGMWATGLGLDGDDNLCINNLGRVQVASRDGKIAVRLVAGDGGKSVWNGLAVSRFGILFSLPDDLEGKPAGTIDVGIFDAASQRLAITQQPYSTNVRRGGSAQFAVAAVGSEPLRYQWYAGASPIPGASGPELTLGNVQAGNAGEYHAVVSDPTGSVASRSAMLAITDPVAASPGGAAAPAGGGGSVSIQFLLALAALVGARVARRMRGAAGAA
jgi:sugar lactone lactonase YvrE